MLGEVASEVCELVGVGDVGLAVVLGDDVEDYPCDEQQQADDDEHDGADEHGEVGHESGRGELVGDPSAERDADDADEKADGAEEGQGLVFADHAEYGAHDPDAVAHGVELGHASGGPVPVLDGHLVEPQVVVQRVDGHLGLDLEAV